MGLQTNDPFGPTDAPGFRAGFPCDENDDRRRCRLAPVDVQLRGVAGGRKVQRLRLQRGGVERQGVPASGRSAEGRDVGKSRGGGGGGGMETRSPIPVVWFLGVGGGSAIQVVRGRARGPQFD